MAEDKKERKAFNFFKSYFDVYVELSDKEKVRFMDALLKRQFWGVEPSGLTGMSKFAYISQKHSIDAQVKGYEDKTNNPLSPPSVGVDNPPPEQVEGKGEEKEEEQGKGEEEAPPYRAFKHLSISKEEADKILESYSKEKLDSILDDIENHKKNTNYTSLYLTAIKWLKNDNKKQGDNDNGRYPKEDLTDFDFKS